MIHIDRGGDLRRTESFFNKCREHGIEYDVIGQSYYPWWHGSLRRPARKPGLHGRTSTRRTSCSSKSPTTGGAPSTATARAVPGNARRPASNSSTEVDRIVRDTPGGRGKGIFWWEPAVAAGPIASRGMFDGAGNALPVITVFDRTCADAAAPSSD